MTQLSDIELRRLHDQQVRAWFGEIRPLRLEGSGKFFTPPPALPLRAVFVPPALSPTYIQPTASEALLSGGADLLHWFGQHRRLVVLGDPGSGKSTVVSWLAWRLCAGLAEPLPEWATDALPVPMILRDMQLDEVSGFDDLLAAFMRTDVIAGHAQLRTDWGRYLQGRIERQPGSLLFLIDGLDELSQALREKVRDAIREGMSRLEQARFIVTSRIVGYEQSAIETPQGATHDLMVQNTPGLTRARLVPPESTEIPAVDVFRLYVMPFDNGRIRLFARNWFEHGESEERRSGNYGEQFVAGVMRDAVALQLARTPNLLVMAAQVFGITNTLPDGRAKLYEAITKAYLESIDQRYGLLDQRYTLEQKKAWLAAVGYRMQARRNESASDGAARDLLVAELDVIGWLGEAMRESELEPDSAYIANFVDAIARRSGLFIPRGDGMYAFAHLSIQEYFAALHLQNGVRDLAVSDPARLQTLLEELAALGAAPAWREALVTFFELPEWSPKVISTLFQAVFGKDLQRVPSAVQRAQFWEPPSNAPLVETLARLVVNPGIALSALLRQRGFERAVDYVCSERRDTRFQPLSGVLGALTVNEEGSRRIWDLLREKPGLFSGNETVLDLRGARIVDFSPLKAFSELTELWLEDTAIADLSPLQRLSQLKELRLMRTPVVSLSPLSRLKRLNDLNLSQTQVTDLSPLSELTALRFLELDDTPVRDLGPLSGLNSLRWLMFNRTKVESLAPLAPMSALHRVGMAGTPVTDLTPLQGLVELEVLDAQDTRVLDLDPLASLQSLKELVLDDTGVTDLSALRALPLQTLALNSTQVRDLQPLAELFELRHLSVRHTELRDLTPLAGLEKLEGLYLRGSKVADTSVLAHLTGLSIDIDPVRPKTKPKKPWWRVFLPD